MNPSLILETYLGTISHYRSLRISVVNSHTNIITIDSLKDLFIMDGSSVYESFNHMGFKNFIQSRSFHNSNVSLLAITESVKNSFVEFSNLMFENYTAIFCS